MIVSVAPEEPNSGSHVGEKVNVQVLLERIHTSEKCACCAEGQVHT